MKKIYSTIACFIITISVFAQINLSSGLKAFYPFTGNAADSSGNGHHGTVNGATLTMDRFSVANRAYSFNGATTYISLPADSFLNNNYSYSVWVKPSSIPSFGGSSYVISIGSTGGDQAISLQNNSNWVGWTAAGYNNGGGSSTQSATGVLPTTNTWYHLVSVRDNSSLKLYVNGQLIANTSLTGTTYYGSGVTKKAIIGERFAINNLKFDGAIDDIRIYNRAISACEVNELYNPIPLDLFNGLIAYYPFTGNAADASGNGNNGTVLGTVSLTTDRFGNPNSAYLFTQGSVGLIPPDYIEVADNNSLDLTTAYSISLWFNQYTMNALGRGFRLIDKLIPGTIDGYTIDTYDNVSGDNTLRFLNSGQTISTQAHTLTQWHHALVTFDNGNGKIYLDGNLMVSTTGFYTTTGSTSLRFGAPHPTTIENLNFNGKMDDIRIYNRALNDCEINALFTDAPIPPVADFSGDPTNICPGQSVIFTDQSTGTPISWSWSFPGGAPATATTATVSVTYTLVGVYSVSLTATNASGSGSITKPGYITVTNVASAVFTSSAPGCKDQGVNFYNAGSSGSGYTHYWDFGSGATPSTSTLENPVGILYINSGAKTVLHTASNASCGTNASISNIITVNPIPTASFSSNTPSCIGSAVDYSNTGSSGVGYVYSWDLGLDAVPQLSAAQSPTGIVYSSAGSKTITQYITNQFGCVTINTQTVVINAVPDASFSYSGSACVNQNNNFYAADTSSSGMTHSWMFGVNSVPAVSSLQNPIDIIYSSSGSKYITHIISNGTCTDSIVNSITVNPSPVASFTSNAPVCETSAVNFTNTGSSGTGYQYTWDLGSDAMPAAAASQSPMGTVYSSAGTKTITQYIINQFGCNTINVQTITINALPIADAGLDAEICYKDSIKIGVNSIAGQTYKWYPSVSVSSSVLSNPYAKPNSSVTYTLSVTNANCGPVTDHVIITVNPLPSVYAGKDDTITKGETVQLIAGGAVLYSWSPAQGLDNYEIYNPTGSPIITTTYIVTGTNIFNCINRDTITIKVNTPAFWLPEAFSPNGNGKNDILYVRGEGIKDFEFGIFNSWGEQIFYSKDITIGWDGKRQLTGDLMPEGAYVYFIKGVLTTGEVVNQKGLVNLVR